MNTRKWEWKTSRASIQKFSMLVRTYFDLGGNHVQVNCISAKTLREAQKNPQAYQDLVIRVAGYSAYFVELDQKMQEDIISRTEHRL